MKPLGRGSEDGAEMRSAIHDQPDVDRVIVAAADELLRPVERIDQEIGVAMRRDSAGRDFLLGDDRNARRGPRQSGEDDQLGRAVRFGDRRRVLLVLDVEAAANDLQDRLARLARRYGNVFEEPRVIRSTRRHPDAAVEADRFRVQVRRLDDEGGELGIFLGLAETLRERDLRARARPARSAASSRPSAS